MRQLSYKAISGTLLTLGLLMIGVGLTVGCNTHKAPDVEHDVRTALDQAGFNDVRVSQDRDKNVVTLNGNVGTDDDKARAESVAKSAAGTAVVANEIGVRPAGDDTAKKVESKLDDGIDKNLEARLIQHRLDKDVKYDVNNGVVTLKGNVPTRSDRSSAEKVAKQIPNVKQVVNELEITHQPATSTE